MKQARFFAALLALHFVATGECSEKAGRAADDFPAIKADLFKEMDGGIKLTPREIEGRNIWNVWTAGNEQFWDRMARESRGLIDLLKTLDSRQRQTRFKEMGLINEPGFRQADKVDEFGLWLDEPVEPAPPPIDPKVYGRSSGVLGFRIFPNPDFTPEAREHWNADRYYNDPAYAADPSLVRPYRVGVSCGACHIGPHPLYPPADPENPEWKNLASVIGNQFLHEGRVFAAGARPGSFFWEMLNAQPRGTSDTSRIASDNLNNPGAINPIFGLKERLRIGHDEMLSGETLLLSGTTRRMKVPRFLKDGADSAGFLAASLRVYVNIGMFHQHWLEQHQPLVGLTGQKPFSIRTAQKRSAYWRATKEKLPNVAKFFSRLEPMRLADAPGGADYLTRDPAVLERGHTVFTSHCAGCHAGNFLSDEQRHPVTAIQTNAARACATNATRGHVWQFFSSDTYKSLPSVGQIEVWNPYTGGEENFPMPKGGPGYYRTPSLVSVWATAPLLHNNSLGKFTGDPSVKGRVEAFEDAIEKLLWPEKRLDRDSIWRTTRESVLEVPGEQLPERLREMIASYIDADEIFRLGPIPAGTPINLLANIDPASDRTQLAELAVKIQEVLAQIRDQKLDAEATRELMKTELAPRLFKLSKCPDLIEDRGHYFGTELPDPDKRALIEFLKTL